MSVSAVLLIILFVLMTAVGGKRGIKSFFSLCFNFITLFIMIILVALRLDPLKVTVFGCLLITSITLFYINGFNKKTLASMISVTLAVLLTLLITHKIGADAKIQGFSAEEIEGISYLSFNVKLDFAKIFVCQVLVGLLGAIIDVSISISSSMNEIYLNDASVTKTSIFKSGLNIGKDILGTMTNTLLFAYIGGFMSLIIYFNGLSYSLTEIVNKKIFASEVFQILCSGIGIILIIPITSLITSRVLFIKPKSGRKSGETENTF